MAFVRSTLARPKGRRALTFRPNRSRLALEASVAAGTKLGEIAKLLGLSGITFAELKVTTDLAHSPTGTVTPDRSRYQAAETVNASVHLDLANLTFLGFDNVDHVLLVRYAAGTETILQSLPAASGQQDFAFHVTAPGLTEADELHAFVVSRIAPLDLLALELGSERPTSGSGTVTATFTYERADCPTCVGAETAHVDAVLEASLGPDGSITIAATGSADAVGTFQVFPVCNRSGEIATYDATGTVTGASISGMDGVSGSLIVAVEGEESDVYDEECDGTREPHPTRWDRQWSLPFRVINGPDGTPTTLEFSAKDLRLSEDETADIAGVGALGRLTARSLIQSPTLTGLGRARPGLGLG